MFKMFFIKSIYLVLIVCIIPITTNFQEKFSTEDLIGKSNPDLYGEGYQLRKPAYRAFLKMKEAAAADGIQIKVVSSYRSYEHQQRIWERKYKKFIAQGIAPKDAVLKIIEYSTIPGTSRHHWGTDIDIVDGSVRQPKGLLLEKNFHDEGPFCKLKKWMDQNANSYGFYLVYTNTKERKGFKYEPWHYSYAPISIIMLQSYLKLNFTTYLKDTNLSGSENFKENFIKQYKTENILDINSDLK